MGLNEEITSGHANEQSSEQPTPSLTESLLAFGLLVVTVIGCVLLYGPLIRLMPAYILQAIR